MAVSFLRVGRAGALKWVSLETLGLRGTAPSATLCTKLVEPQKSGKKNVVAPEERATLLSSRTTVEFPKKVSLPMSQQATINVGKEETIDGSNPTEALIKGDELLTKKTSVESKVSSAFTAEVPEEIGSFNERAQLLNYRSYVEFPKRDQWLLFDSSKMASESTAAASKDKVNYDGSSSSSSLDSSSDSDSDSNSDNEDTVDITLKMRVEFPKREPFIQSQADVGGKVDAMPTENPVEAAVKLNNLIAAAIPGKDKDFNIVTQKKTVVSVSDLEIPKSSPVELGPAEHPDSVVENTELPSPVEITELPSEITHQPVLRGKEPELQKRAQSEAVSAIPEVTKDSIEGKVNGSATDDSFPETATLGEALDTLQEAAALSVEKSAEPEFDISTYKNLQHHNYTTYTFADYDTEMTKYRLPQPSSGRPSPRH
ncbi:uncharacterized protein ndufv3 [Polyodon spathula]|uniref:uncharacterized protein ndufv3 n=1 Tax=Polyodon spathula TaxID=7913 RepID=UPI001B7F2BC6|nr:uncharacterized protein ndufv3 [Polyodon spathula]